MAITAGRGFATPGDIYSQVKVQDMSSRIHMLEDDFSNVTKITQKIPKNEANNTTVEWPIDQDLPYNDTLGEALDDSETGVDVGDGGIWLIGDVFRVTTTNELIRVTDISSNTLTVTRGYAGTTAASASSGDAIVKAGTAFRSGAFMMASDNVTPIATRIAETRGVSYTEIFRTAVALSRSDMQTKLHYGGDRAHQRLKGMRNHRRMMEFSALLGVAYASEPRMMDGILNYTAAANRNSTTTTLTDAAFAADLNAGMRYGKREKWGLLSRSVAGIIDGWGLPLLRIEPGENRWGVDIVRWKSSFGTVNFVVTDALVGTALNKYLILLDTTEVRQRPLQDTILRKDIHPPYADGVMDEYLTETAIEWGHAQHHYYWSAIAA